MITLEGKDTQMDDLLDTMARKIQLDQTRYERMKQHYNAVKNWIEADEQFFKPYQFEVYPHGSVRILTAIKPLESDEFDLDVVIHLKTDWKQFSPSFIYNQVKRRLAENDTYKEKLEPKNRCLRLNYSGDFHMDILPGIQDNIFDDNKIKVPDRQLGDWVSSNPRGYANWFLAKANLVKESLLEKALRAEKLPVDDYDNKKPLQRAVQLIKRYRDTYFKEDDTYKTSSIILTTLAGQFYQGEDSIFNTIDGVISTIQRKVAYAPRRIQVLNPANPEEDFTDKWENEPEYHMAFQGFSNHLYQEWQELRKQHGVLTEGQILKGLFGNDLFTKAQTDQALHLENIRRERKLAASKTTGNLAASTTVGTSAIRSNTFFGE